MDCSRLELAGTNTGNQSVREGAEEQAWAFVGGQGCVGEVSGPSERARESGGGDEWERVRRVRKRAGWEREKWDGKWISGPKNRRRRNCKN